MVRREVFFLDSARGRCFCIAHHPHGMPVGTVLYLPPFAEEMNKSRRMAALAAAAMAEQGWCVLQVDLFGSGDSEGDFSDAGWDDWLDDVSAARAWLARVTDGPLVLWSLRAGALLASDWLARHDEKVALLLWQPVWSGSVHVTQFLRLKAVAELQGEVDAKTVMAALRADVAAGRAVEVAGYGLSPALTQGLEAARFSLPVGRCEGLAVLELGITSDVKLSPGARGLLEAAEAAAGPAQAKMVQGAAFWQTQEIEVVPALIEQSLAALSDIAAARTGAAGTMHA